MSETNEKIVNYSNISSDFPKFNWTNYLLDCKKNNIRITATKQELNELSESVQRNIEHQNIGRAIDRFSLGLYIDKKGFLSRIKRTGHLRITNNLHKSNYALSLVNHAIKERGLFEFDESDLTYLYSVQNLALLRPKLCQIRQNLIKEIKENKTVFVKSILSFIDDCFYNGRDEKNKKLLEDNIKEKFELEEMAEGASYLIYLFDDLIGINDDFLLRSDYDLISNGKIQKIITQASCIRLISDVEINIESFGFVCNIENGILNVSPPSDSWGKSFHFGHLEMRISRYGFLENNKEHFSSMREFVLKFNEDTKEIICQKDTLFHDEKSQLALPIEILNHLVSFIQSNKLFLEEVIYLSEIEHELHLKFDQLEEYKIKDEFTFKDLFFVKRFFVFISTAYFDILKRKSDKNYFNSNIPFLSPETLHEMLSGLMNKEKVNTFIDIFSYDGDPKKVCDLQYLPFIFGNEYFLFPPNILTNSNLFRNVLFGLKTRIYKDLKIDPIADKLEMVLRDKGFETKKSVSIKYRGDQTDIDLLAWKGENVFIFECKNSVHPVSAFETRSTFEQIEKAVFIQLPLAKAALQDTDFVKKSNLQISSLKNLKVFGCVVTSNKLFSGHHINEYPIHNLSRLSNFVINGKKTIINDENQKIIQLWKSAEFQVEDLIQYLSKDNQYYTPIFESHCKEKIRYDIEGTPLDLVIYPMDQNKMIENFDMRSYREVDR